MDGHAPVDGLELDLLDGRVEEIDLHPSERFAEIPSDRQLRETRSRVRLLGLLRLRLFLP
jgi:hypothetical protein